MPIRKEIQLGDAALRREIQRLRARLPNEHAKYHAAGEYDALDIDTLTGLLSPSKGGTGVDNGSNLLTVPATGTAALLGIGNVFTVTQTIQVDKGGQAILLKSTSSGMNPALTSENDVGVRSHFYTGRSGFEGNSGKTIIENASGNRIVLNPTSGAVNIGKVNGLSGNGDLDIAGALNVDGGGVVQKLSGTGNVFSIITASGREFFWDTNNPNHLKKKQNLILSADPDNIHTNTLFQVFIDGSAKLSLDANGNTKVSGNFRTAADVTWDFGGWTSAGDAESNGYLTVIVSGVQRKIMTRA